MGSSGLSSQAAVIGTMRHDLFEHCMTIQKFDFESGRKCTNRIVRKHAESLLGCGLVEGEAIHEIMSTLRELQRFASIYTTFAAGGGNSGAKLEGYGYQTEVWVSAHGVSATEEGVISPELGLKGFVDATLEASVARVTPSSSSRYNRTAPSTGGGGPVGDALDAVMPLELKTGHNQKPQDAHTAQLALYTLMLRVRHGSAVIHPPPQQQSNSHPPSKTKKYLKQGATNGGMLLYLNSKGHKAVHVSPTVGEIKSLIGQRNSVATEMKRAAKPRGVILPVKEENGEEETTSENSTITEVLSSTTTPAALPELLNSSYSCNNCFSNRHCMLYARADIALSKSQSSLEEENNNATLSKEWMNACATTQQTHSHLLSHFTGHITDEELHYFRDWDRMIDLEAAESQHNIVKSWLIPSEEREQQTGKCVAGLQWDANYVSPPDGGSSGMKERTSNHILRFHRSNAAAADMSSLNCLQIAIRDRAVISTDGSIYRNNTTITAPSSNAPKRFRHKMHVVRGSIFNITETSVFISVSGGDVAQLVHLVDSYTSSNNNNNNNNPLTFRLDKDEISTGVSTLRQNLSNLFYGDIPVYSKNANPLLAVSQDKAAKFSSVRMNKLRSSVVSMREEPRFDESLVKSMFSSGGDGGGIGMVNGCDIMGLFMEFSELNVDQRGAVSKVICAQDYALIQGLPGTGKTSTIAFVARLLAARGKRVLITSYTHAAVDNLILKLMEAGVGVVTEKNTQKNSGELVRIGYESSVHTNVHPILASRLASLQDAKCDPSAAATTEGLPPSAKSLHDIMSNARIVGVSALSIPKSPLLLNQHFDVVIVDEAGQISQPAILGALMAADTFVLVGDHLQLPPLVHSRSAEQLGYGISMMKRLAERFASSVVRLTLQYRMHEDICHLCNEIVYKGALKCANDGVRHRLLRLDMSRLKHGNEWIRRVICPDKAVVFVNTDECQPLDNENMSNDNKDKGGVFQGLERSGGSKRSEGGSIVNVTEGHLVRHIVKGCLDCDADPTSIGVICPYRSQLRLLHEDTFLSSKTKSGLEMSTIDRFQGRDKSIIIISLVRSNPKGKCGRLLNDFRRLNVAMSRAKCKLVFVGSYQTMHKGSEVFRPILEIIKRKGWMESLPRDSTLVT